MDAKNYEKIEKIKDTLTVKRSNLGKAGEHFVAAKLLLNGFNVYNGAIDDGIDLVARKRKKFYYIQVKTCQDIEYDSGKFMANINIKTLSKFPLKQTFLVLVLHYLGPHSSLDFMGDHNTYEQMFIVLPVQTIIDFFQKKEGHVVCYIDLDLFNYPKEHSWLLRLRYGKKEMVLDNYLFDSFWQIEI